MKDSILVLLSRCVSDNVDWFVKKYTKDESTLKNFIYTMMSTRVNENDRKLGDMLYEQLLKIPEERRTKTIQLLVTDFLNYMSNTSKNYFAAIIDVNSDCNLSCPNCANSEMNTCKDISWNLDELNQVINALKPYTRLIFVSGGEPFMNEFLIEAMKINQDVEFVVFTNGTMQKEYQRLIDKNLNNVFIMVSIDGPKEHHDIKRGEGVYESALKTIETMRQNGFLCGISSVIEEDTIDYILSEDYVELARDLDASTLYLLKEAHNQNETFINKYYQLSQEMENTAFKTFPAFNVPYNERTLSKDLCCLAGRQWLRVKADFEVTSCPFSNVTYGNILEQSSKEIVKELKNNKETPKSWC